MYDEPEHDDYDDDEYNFFPSQEDNNNFKFDWASWELWLKDALNDIVSQNDGEWLFQYSLLPKNKKSDIDKTKNFLYFGKNKYDEAIRKYKYFIANYFDIQYKNHFMSNASHILRQPQYYRGLHEMLN